MLPDPRRWKDREKCCWGRITWRPPGRSARNFTGALLDPVDVDSRVQLSAVPSGGLAVAKIRYAMVALFTSGEWKRLAFNRGRQRQSALPAAASGVTASAVDEQSGMRP